jgi:hypothetical protein
VALRARLPLRKGTFSGKNQTRDKAGRKASRQPVGLRRWKNPVDRTGIEYPGGRGPRDLRKEWHRSVYIRAAITSGKRKNAHEAPISDGWCEDREVRCRIFCQDAENQEMDIVEG